jgi:hypothetical protein
MQSAVRRSFCFPKALATLVLLATAGLVATKLSTYTTAQEKGGTMSPRFFELRIYTAHEGKLGDLHKRFREHTNRLFQKHGMTLIGYWTPVDGPESKNTLVYILAYPSREAREASWKAFREDEEWKKVVEESHRNGPLVAKVDSKFLTPTDYSPIK